MFEINGTHIASLTDTDLRILITRLCEAELHKANLPVSAVKAGGNQDAPDGGIDVRVELAANTCTPAFIPRPVTGFQVKKPSMPRKEIIKEIRPKGKLRGVINELNDAFGAYIIISSSDSTTDSTLKARLTAMHEATENLTNPNNLHLDFYDNDQIARWVRYHPGLVVWVRERAGMPAHGWQPYASWAAPELSLDSEYLIDDQCCFLDEQNPNDSSLTIVAGISRIRVVLNEAKGTARLIGVSGMGKTRFVQALFDERISKNTLPPSLAVYTDLQHSPDPSPRNLLTYLINNKLRSIVIVDNCPPDTHKALSDLCNSQDSTVSLITIEYDVGDDAPEKTKVFRLEPSSETVIESLLENRIRYLSQVDRRRIAEFSGGNFRIALALANTVQRGESVTDLSDKALFEKLFFQRQEKGKNLLKTAEICSLVYSFDGETLEGDDSEIPFLAELAGQNISLFYENVVELQKRTLIQCRSKWRAVLPHAVANRLAFHAIEKHHPNSIAKTFQNSSDRLLRSFSRRLSYLHNSNNAQLIVKEWLSKDGFLSNLTTLNELGMAVFKNIAPVSPETTLEAIERTISSQKDGDLVAPSNHRRGEWGTLIRKLAYDPELFDRSTHVLLCFINTENINHYRNSIIDPFLGLFRLHLSGTKAPVKQRLRIINNLINSEKENFNKLGLDALSRMMEAFHFSSSHDFTFGARPRDFGWSPKTYEEVADWYGSIIDYCLELIISNHQLSDRIKGKLASNFRGMWLKGNVVDKLESSAHKILSLGDWPDGWKAVRKTLSFDSKSMPPDLLAKLNSLEKSLSPKTLIQKVHAYAFPQRWGELDIGDSEPGDSDDGMARQERVIKTVEQLGLSVAADIQTWKKLLPDLVHGDLGLGIPFGRGLAKGSANNNDIWNDLIDSLGQINENDRNIRVLNGYLNGSVEVNPEHASKLLDSALNNPVLAVHFPSLQSAVDINDEGADRLLTSLDLGLAMASEYRMLAYGGISKSIPQEKLASILIKICELPDGYDVALDVLAMRFHSTDKTTIDQKLKQCGHHLLSNAPFGKKRQLEDYNLGVIVKTCLDGEDAIEPATIVCNKFKSALLEYSHSAYEYREFLKDLFSVQPMVSLDVFLGNNEIDNEHIINELNWHHEEILPVQNIPIDIIIEWCNKNPNKNFPAIASVITPFKSHGKNIAITWSDSALKIIELAPDKEATLKALSDHLWPQSWSGSRADIVEGRKKLFNDLLDHDDPAVATKAREIVAWLTDAITRERERESKEFRETDESFE